jgi:hypothetical protein
MKLKKFNQLFEREGFDYIDGYDDDDYEDEGYDKLNSDDDDSDDNSNQDDMAHLEYLLREMFRNVGIDVTVTSDNGDIQIVVMLNQKERLRDVINIFSVANKLKKDILAQYDSEFDLWEDKKGLPMLTFSFYYGDGLGDSNTPF